jgi:lipid A 3-O-deacylase
MCRRHFGGTMHRAPSSCLMTALFGGLLAWSGLAVAHAEERPTTPYFTLGPVVVHGNEADALTLGLGVFDPFKKAHDKAPAATLEYRLGRKLLVIGPAIGGMANTDGGLFGYFGLYGDISVGKVYFTPQLALGAYHRGNSRDLGGVFQFRETVEFSYRFDNGQRLGVRVAHISNAHIHDYNPGEEEYYLTYAIALGPLL